MNAPIFASITARRCIMGAGNLSPQLACTVALFVLAGCGGGTGPGGDARRGELVLRVSHDGLATSIGDSLDWPGTWVPGAVVLIQRSGDSTLRAVADDSGLVRFSGLLAGQYSVSASRVLSSQETSRLGTTDRAIVALSGGISSIQLADGATVTRSVRASPMRRGSLLISELYSSKPRLANGDFYSYGGFVELYNNSDTSIALAGKLLVHAQPGSHDYPNWPCGTYDNITNDPQGLWAQWIWRFPANAPALAPGEVAVVATDAIDHTQYGSAGFVDLSGAEFEWVGVADVDNPGALNLISVGPREYLAGGHGEEFHDIRMVFALALSLDLDTLPTLRNLLDLTYVRIPTAAVLDVMSWKTTYQNPYPECGPGVHVDLDAQEARLLEATDTRSMARRAAATLPNGQLLLRWTRSTAGDFRVSAPTPGSVP